MCCQLGAVRWRLYEFTRQEQALRHTVSVSSSCALRPAGLARNVDRPQHTSLPQLTRIRKGGHILEQVVVFETPTTTLAALGDGEVHLGGA